MLGDNVSARGSDNLVAGRDINFLVDRESLRAIFSDRIKYVDESINSLLPEGGMISPTAENKLQEFKCEQLIISLTKVGIPMRVGMDIAEGVGSHLSILIQDTRKVTTRHVREAVLQSIYCLKGRYAEHAISRWADEYARRYGNPDERIKILEQDGEEYDLSFQYLVEELVPQLIKKITLHDLDIFNKCGIISRKDTRRMANNILDHIRGLNVYSIRYKTIFHLAFDLAVQPPHPWFSNPDDINQTIDYDLQRATAHLENLKILDKPEDQGAALHSLQEIVNHLSSALLAYYGLYLGVTQGSSGPFVQLTHTVKIAEDSGNPTLWKCCRIKQLHGDLNAAGTSFFEFRGLLKKLKICVHTPLYDLDYVLTICQDFRKIVLSIVRPENSPRKILGSLSASENIDETTIELAMLDSLRHIPVLRLQESNSTQGHFFTHSLAPPLSNLVYPKIYVYLYSSVDRLSLGDKFDSLICHIGEVLDYEPLSNSSILVSRSGFTSELIQEVKKISKKGGFRLFCIDPLDLMYILDENDRSGAFSFVLSR